MQLFSVFENISSTLLFRVYHWQQMSCLFKRYTFIYLKKLSGGSVDKEIHISIIIITL